MIQELLYTSAPKGLKPGSRGFCTVLSTSGMPAPVATALESLSGYRPVFPPGDPQAEQNPVVYSHLKMLLGGRRGDVLSRIADYGLDYSQRTNKIAHHLVIDPNDRPTAGPAWLLAHQEVMRANWNGEPRIVTGERSLPQGKSPLRTCTAWKNLAGDAGWAGVLAESFLNKPDQPAYIIFSPGMDLLSLIEEALALLPPSRRWDVTFSTYFTKIPNGVTCNWRCVLADSPEAKESRRYVQSLRIDLTQSLGKAEGGELVEAARTGRMPASSVLEPAAPSMSEPITSHQEVPPTVGNAPPIRTRDGRAIPHPRQRLSEFPVGYSDVVRKEPYGSWTKWVISIVVLLLIGGGTVAVKQGWVPLNGKNLLVAEKMSSPPIKEVDSKSTPEKPLEEPNAAKPKEPQQPDTKVATSIPKDGPMEAKNNNLGEALSPLGSADDPASKKNAAMPSTEAAAPPVPAPPAPQSPTPVNDKPAQTTPKVEAISRITETHWENVPDQLKFNESYTIDLPDWINSKNTKVSIWCPSDTITTIQSKDNIAQVYDRTTQEFRDAISATVEIKNAHSPSVLRVKSNNPMVFSDFCRLVLTVSQGNHEKPLNVLLHKSATIESENSTNNRQVTSFLVPLVWPQEGHWKVRFDSLTYSKKKTPILTPENNVILTFKDNMFSGTASVDYFSVVDSNNFNDALPESLKDLSKSQVTYKIQILKPAVVPGVPARSNINVVVDYNSFEKSLRQYIQNETLNSIKTIDNLSGPKWWADDATLVSGDLFLEDVRRLSSSIAIFQDEMTKKRDHLEKNAKTDEQKKELTQVQSIIGVSNEQSRRLISIIEFCMASQNLVKKLKECRLEEFCISQECKNDQETEYVPIIVFRREASDESANSN